MWLNFVLILGLCVNLINCQTTYKVCAYTEDLDACSQLQRGNSEVQCQWVQDSIECAMRIDNGTADFGAFSPESALHIGVLESPDNNNFFKDLTVLQQLRDQNRMDKPFDFEAVVVVHKSFNGAISNLKGKKYCHPGLHYGKAFKWSERVMKHFERTVVEPKCEKNMSANEIEVKALSDFFGTSCRPGIWSHDIEEDAQLKKKYSWLCRLCPGCKYDNSISIDGPDRQHQLALNCLKKGGEIAYVSREDAKSFFMKEGLGTEFRYLCPNGTIEPANDNHDPCTWLKQPWRVVIGRSDIAVVLKQSIERWLNNAIVNSKGWETNLRQILKAQYSVGKSTIMQKPFEYFTKARQVPLAVPFCNTEISWCTTSYEEQQKCKIVKAGALTAGVQPLIVCRNHVEDVVSCLDQINSRNADFMGIDSNYGYIARKKYNLTAAMYFETEVDQYSRVGIVVHADSKIKSFDDLKKKKACFPEFGATPTIAFINLMQEKNYFKKHDCRYGYMLDNFFGDSCAPGAEDTKHFVSRSATPPPTSLCKLCLESSDHTSSNQLELNITTGRNQSQLKTCAPHESNKFYGNRGALRCLHEVGAVSILELQSLKTHAYEIGVNENDFKVFCRNGSLANRNGFDVDDDCLLTIIADGEVVVPRKMEKSKVSSIVNVLNSVDLYFQNDPDYKMYNIFDSKRNLLFKDSTLGLVAYNEPELGDKVKNYIKLFENIEKCVEPSSAIKVSISFFMTLVLTMTSLLFRN